jgi:hypothetical protein
MLGCIVSRVPQFAALAMVFRVIELHWVRSMAFNHRVWRVLAPC